VKKSTPNTLDQRRSQWLKGVLDLCVLASLLDADAYGYELAKGLTVAGFGDIKGGTLYPLLNRLEREGYVTTVWRASADGPDRKYYQITKQGRSELNRASASWNTFVTVSKQLLARVNQEST